MWNNIIVRAAAKMRFFGRNGGTSVGNFASLNCSPFVNDDPQSVQQNLNIARQEIGADKLIILRQVHGNRCVTVDSSIDENAIFEADALVTCNAKIALGILTADCVPVLLYDTQQQVIGAAHAGWRGACNNVLESVVHSMHALGANNISALLGPSIQMSSYKVTEEMLDVFPEDCFWKQNNQLHLNLPKYCSQQLHKIGVTNVEICPLDTYSDPEHFFSFRYNNEYSKQCCGRNLSAIVL